MERQEAYAPSLSLLGPALAGQGVFLAKDEGGKVGFAFQFSAHYKPARSLPGPLFWQEHAGAPMDGAATWAGLPGPAKAAR